MLQNQKLKKYLVRWRALHLWHRNFKFLYVRNRVWSILRDGASNRLFAILHVTHVLSRRIFAGTTCICKASSLSVKCN